MQPGHDGEGVGVAVVGDQPARGLGQEGHGEEDDAGEDHLQPDGDAPGGRAGEGGGAVRDEGARDRADEVEGGVDALDGGLAVGGEGSGGGARTVMAPRYAGCAISAT